MACAPATSARWLRLLLVCTGLCAIIALLVHLGGRLTDPAALGLADYIEYWSAGRLSVLGMNPYDIEQLSEQQTAVGWQNDLEQTPRGRPWPIVMYNPPWTLSLVMPFGLLPYGVSRLLWLILELAVVFFCADRLWQFYQAPARTRWLAWVMCFGFVPTLIVLKMGQMGPLLLLGVVGFLHFEKRGRWALAGAGVALMTVKYNVFYLVLLALFLWAVQHRRWSMFLGGLLATLAATAVPLLRDPLVLAHYWDTMIHNSPSRFIAPTLGTLLRLVFGQEHVWLQFVPTGVGLLWFVIHWLRQHHRWDWAEQMPLLLLVSFLTTPYGAWSFDLVVLLVPILQATAWLYRDGGRRTTQYALGFYVAVNALVLAINLARVDEVWFAWVTPTFLIAYWLLRRRVRTAGGVEPQRFQTSEVFKTSEVCADGVRI
jgi:hypothetical protein